MEKLIKKLDSLSSQNKIRIADIVNIIIDKSELYGKNSPHPYKITNTELGDNNITVEDFYRFLKILNDYGDADILIENDEWSKRLARNTRNLNPIKHNSFFPESLNIEDLEDLKKCTIIRIHNINNLLKIQRITRNYSSNYKLPVYISAKNGIYLDAEENKKPYPITGGRLKILIAIRKSSISGPELAKQIYGGNKSTLSKAITKINKIFKERLDLDYNLINSPPTKGYELNKNNYEIIFDL